MSAGRQPGYRPPSDPLWTAALVVAVVVTGVVLALVVAGLLPWPVLLDD